MLQNITLLTHVGYSSSTLNDCFWNAYSLIKFRVYPPSCPPGACWRCPPTPACASGSRTDPTAPPARTASGARASASPSSRRPGPSPSASKASSGATQKRRQQDTINYTLHWMVVDRWTGFEKLMCFPRIESEFLPGPKLHFSDSISPKNSDPWNHQKSCADNIITKNNSKTEIDLCNLSMYIGIKYPNLSLSLRTTRAW